MATNTLEVRLALKADTAENWASSALVLLKGEPALETDTGKWKFGDGTKTYSQLTYAGLTTAEIKDLISQYAVNSVALASGDSNGTVKITIDGVSTNVAVKGLGSAAYTASTAYASAAQGTKADNAMSKSGGTFTGDVILKGNPTSNLMAVPKQYVDAQISSGIAASDAMIFKGTLGTSGTVTALPTTYKTGWTYRVVTAGTYAGQVCEIGDLVIALVDRSGSNNADSDWTVAQTNIDGAITTAGSGLTKSGTTVKHTNAVTAGTIAGGSGSLAFGGSLKIPKITYDSTGHISAVDTTTVTLPGNPNSDTKVTNTLNTTAKAYITGTTSATTNTGTQVFDTGVYLGTAAGELVATKFTGALTGNVTGNVSGSSGSCTGNAATATALKTARSFSITGGATASGVSFNGGSNVALNVVEVNTDYFKNGTSTLILSCGDSKS